MVDFKDIKARKKPNTRSVPVLMEPDLLVDFARLTREHKTAVAVDEKSNTRPTAPAIELRLAELREEIEEETVMFVFRALRRIDYRELIESHPASDEDQSEGFDFDPETLGPELISLSAVDPEMSLDEVKDLWDEWDDATVTELYSAALLVNKEVRDIPFVFGSYGGTTSSEKKSERPAPTESDTPSS